MLVWTEILYVPGSWTSDFFYPIYNYEENDINDEFHLYYNCILIFEKRNNNCYMYREAHLI